MPSDYLLMFAGSLALSAVGFVCVAVLWLRKLREAVSSTLTEAAHQQVRTTKRVNEALAQVQKQQDIYAQQIHVLAQAGMRLQQELANVSHRLDHNQAEAVRGGQTLH